MALNLNPRRRKVDDDQVALMTAGMWQVLRHETPAMRSAFPKEPFLTMQSVHVEFVGEDGQLKWTDQHCAAVHDLNGDIGAVIVEVPPIDDIPRTYWPMPFDRQVWPFFSTDLITPEHICTTRDEAYQMLMRWSKRQPVHLALHDPSFKTLAPVAVVAWLEGYNAVFTKVLSLLGMDLPFFTVGQRLEAVRRCCAFWRTDVPAGLPLAG